MASKKIVLAGGTGFIGEELIKYFGSTHDIVVLTRQVPGAQNNRNHYHSLTDADLERTRFVAWNAKDIGEWAGELEGADLVINLAGKSVNCRYTSANKQEILNSRIRAVEAIGAALTQCQKKPALWINASSATIYRHALDRPQDDLSGELGSGFSVDVCRQWEHSFYSQHTPGTRKVALRMAITLGAGGVLIPYFNLLKYKLGGKQGSGKQMFSWIHIEDTCRLIEWIECHPALEGTFICAAPNPVSNETLMRTLRTLTGHRRGLPAPAWMLQLGGMLIGTEPELVLKSRWVIPGRILQTGFRFKFPQLEGALADIIRKVPRKQYRLLR